MNYKDYLKEKQQRVVVSIDDRIVNEDMVTVADAKKACEMAVSAFENALLSAFRQGKKCNLQRLRKPIEP